MEVGVHMNSFSPKNSKMLILTIFHVPVTCFIFKDELPLFFNLPFQSELKEKGKTYGDYDMSKLLVKTWTAFAKDG